MKTRLLLGASLTVVACGASAPPVKTVTVGAAAPPTKAATTVAPRDSPKGLTLALAFEEKPIESIRGLALERGRLFVNVAGKLRVFDARGAVAQEASSWKPGDALVVVGPDAFDPISQTAHAPKLPKACESHGFSYDAARMSADCVDPAEGTVVYVYDTRAGAQIGLFKEFQTAAPIRGGTITSSGNFVFWQSRASGAFEEIKSHVTGPVMSSHSVMSRDETLLFTTVDRAWYTDDKSPAHVIDPKNGRVLFELGRDVDTAFFSPSSQLLAARHSKNWADLEHATEHDTTSITIHDRSGALLATIPGRNAVEAAFAPDDSGVAVRFASGALSVYTIAR